MAKSYGAVAASVAADKAKRPSAYCSSPRCLWRLTSGPCPKHPSAPPTIDLMEALKASLKAKAVSPPIDCVVCGMPITPEMQSFVVLGGRVHEKPCRETWSLERADDLASDYDEYIYGDEPS